MGNNERVVDRLNVCYKVFGCQDRLAVDVTQSVERVCSQKGGYDFTCCSQSSIYFLFQEDRTTIPIENLAFMCVPCDSKAAVRDLTRTDLLSLAGDGMYIPCLAKEILAVYLQPSGPWWGKMAVIPEETADSNFDMEAELGITRVGGSPSRRRRRIPWVVKVQKELPKEMIDSLDIASDQSFSDHDACDFEDAEASYDGHLQF